MFLSKRSNGIYYVFYDGSNGKRTCISTKTSFKKDALKFLSTFASNVKERHSVDTSPISLKGFSWEYLKHSESFHSWKTTLTYRTTFNAMLNFFGDIELSALNTKLLENFIQSRVRNCSIYCGRKDLINIKASFNWAVKNNYLKRNPANDIKRLKAPEKLPSYYTKEQFQKLISVIDDQTIKDIVVLAVNTGMRQAEILNLKYSQINLKERYLVLDNNGFITKSKRVRTIPLNNESYSLLQRRQSLNHSEYIFSNNGEKIKQDYLIHKFKKYVRSSELNDKLNFHSLRHTFASWLVQKGCSIYEVSKLLGHSDIKVTEIYSHLKPENLRNAVDLLN